MKIEVGSKVYVSAKDSDDEIENDDDFQEDFIGTVVRFHEYVRFALYVQNEDGQVYRCDLGQCELIKE